jgi:acetate kinase
VDIKKFLSSLELFKDIGGEELAAVAEAAQLVEYPAGTTVIRRGDFTRFMWIVYDGEVEVTQPRADGPAALLATLGRGEIFGEMSIITGEPAVADVRAEVPAKAVKIPRENVSGVMARAPQALGRIARLVTMRLLQRDKDEEHPRKISAAHMENEDPYDLNLSSTLAPMRILVLNCGSSSLKYALFDTSTGGPVFEGLIEKIGSEAAFHKMKTPGGRKERPEPGVRDMAGAFEAMISSTTE